MVALRGWAWYLRPWPEFLALFRTIVLDVWGTRRSDELDVEAVLDFAERVSVNAARMWLESKLEQRQRFQSLFFPEGLQVENGEVRTAISSSSFGEFERFVPLEERLVSPAGFEPASPP